MLTKINQKFSRFYDDIPYRMAFWEDVDFSIFEGIRAINQKGKKQKRRTYNDCIMMLDTETSKKSDGTKNNHICAWTISIRAFERNIITIWGRNPIELVETLLKIKHSMKGEILYCYIHNMSYDWVFLRKFLFKVFGNPIRQLNTKPHYPILFEFQNGLILKDSLILSQRSIEKWSKDLGVEHQKAVSKWNYEKLRNQNEDFTADELEYIEHDTLAGVECIDKMRIILNKSIDSMPYTATGIPREELRKEGHKFRAHQRFLDMAPNYNQYLKLRKIFHGGYTHGNRYFINEVHQAQCLDFTSSYIYSMMAFKYPMSKFSPIENRDIKEVIELAEDYALMFKLILIKPRLKSFQSPMPLLQLSKCETIINPVLDNGRIVAADYVEIYLNEIDAILIDRLYNYDKNICTEVEIATKDYLPRWFTDYLYKCFRAKCELKHGDPVLYNIAKSKLNSCYGMTVQSCVRETILENWETGDFYLEEKSEAEDYDKYLTKFNSILPYFWGCWVTSISQFNLYELGSCIDYDNGGEWLYSDTDSCFGTLWDWDKVKKYNKNCIQKMRANGYRPIKINGEEFTLGTAELDKDMSEFKYLGAKRYAYRTDKGLFITVAGVPKKKGGECLNDDINNFQKYFIFPGTKTGKLQHEFQYVEDIYIDKEGNITGDSINLEPCDYLLDDEMQDWDKINKNILFNYSVEED